MIFGFKGIKENRIKTCQRNRMYSYLMQVVHLAHQLERVRRTNLRMTRGFVRHAETCAQRTLYATCNLLFYLIYIFLYEPWFFGSKKTFYALYTRITCDFSYSHTLILSYLQTHKRMFIKTYTHTLMDLHKFSLKGFTNHKLFFPKVVIPCDPSHIGIILRVFE